MAKRPLKSTFYIKIVIFTAILLLTLFSNQQYSVTNAQQEVEPEAEEKEKIKYSSGKDDFDLSIEGTKLNDKIKGSEGNDEIYGDRGNDLLDSGLGNVELDGIDGNDKLKAGKGNDLLEGGKDNDVLKGYQGNDTLVGGSGNDTLEGGKGADILQGDKGGDTFVCDNEDQLIDFNIEEGDTLSEGCTNKAISAKNATASSGIKTRHLGIQIHKVPPCFVIVYCISNYEM
jgi:Ca2+-binding RTX toxin-like protein